MFGRKKRMSEVDQIVLASNVRLRVSDLLDQMDTNVGELREVLLGDADDNAAGSRRTTRSTGGQRKATGANDRQPAKRTASTQRRKNPPSG